MNEERPTDLLSALPRTRPHRRSDKRTARASAPEPATPAERDTAPARKAPASRQAKAAERKPPPATKRTTPRKRDPAAANRLRQPAQPRGIPDARRAPKRKPAPAAAPEIVGTAVQAVGELAELGITLTARALRNAVARLPRP